MVINVVHAFNVHFFPYLCSGILQGSLRVHQVKSLLLQVHQTSQALVTALQARPPHHPHQGQVGHFSGPVRGDVDRRLTVSSPVSGGSLTFASHCWNPTLLGWWQTPTVWRRGSAKNKRNLIFCSSLFLALVKTRQWGYSPSDGVIHIASLGPYICLFNIKFLIRIFRFICKWCWCCILSSILLKCPVWCWKFPNFSLATKHAYGCFYRDILCTKSSFILQDKTLHTIEKPCWKHSDSHQFTFQINEGLTLSWNKTHVL